MHNKPTTARLIVTLACNRDCKMCCNKQRLLETAEHITDLSSLEDYPEVVITGGEPLLDLERTLGIIKELREQNEDVKIYMHTAKYVGYNAMEPIIDQLDGMTYTAHENMTQEETFELKWMNDISHEYPDKSFRLFIHENVKHTILINPSVWSRIEVKGYDEQCELPANEKLFILDTSQEK